MCAAEIPGGVTNSFAMREGTGHTPRGRAKSSPPALPSAVDVRRRCRGAPPSGGRDARLGLVPGREDARAVGGDRDGELEVGGE